MMEGIIHSRTESCKRSRTDDQAYSIDTDNSITKKMKPNPVKTANGEADDQMMANTGDDQDGAAFFDPLPTNSSSLIIEIDSDSTDDDDDQPITMHEPTVALRPQCFKVHIGFKGKGRANDKVDRHLPWHTCGKYVACHEANFSPRSATPSYLRLRTNDPEHDIKRWITTPNESLNGGSEDRSTFGFLDDSRFTIPLLQSTLRFAIAECKYEHQKMAHLDDHGRRFPYRVNVKELPVAPEADPAYLNVPDEQDFTHVTGREELLDMLVHAANELDYLRQMTERHAQRILKRKMTLARNGNAGEADLLVEQGFVGWEWVEEECWRF